jgi:hypothetical protein
MTRPHTSPLYHNEHTHAADVPVKAACAYVAGRMLATQLRC